MKKQEDHKNSKRDLDPQRPPKRKISINNGFNLLLSEIQQLSKEQLPSVCTNLYCYEKVDSETLNIIKSYRILGLPCLKNMSQQQCVERYLKDPFFNKKLENQFQYLSRAKLKAKNPSESAVNVNDSPAAYKLENTNNIRFKEVLEQGQKQRLKQKKKYENVLRRISSNEYLKLPFSL